MKKKFTPAYIEIRRVVLPSDIAWYMKHRIPPSNGLYGADLDTPDDSEADFPYGEIRGGYPPIPPDNFNHT